MKKKIKDLTKAELDNICGKYYSNYCKNCPLLRPNFDECKYSYIHELLKHYDSEVEIDED